MNHTDAESGSEPSPDLATSYFPRFAGDPRYGPDPMRPINLSCYAGASTFLSTPSDLVRFALAINGGKLLQPATVQLLQSTQRLPSGQDTGYGLGWDLETIDIAGRPTPVIGHDGDVLGGTVSSLIVVPEHGLVVAVTSNTSYADTAGPGREHRRGVCRAREDLGLRRHRKRRIVRHVPRPTSPWRRRPCCRPASACR